MTKTATFSLAAAVVLGLGAFTASAQAAQRVIVEKNHMVRIALPASAGSVIVGNPDIADVTVIDSRTIFVTGHDLGDSSIAITDRNGRTIFDGEIVVATPSVGAITVYKGLTQSRMVCSNVCIPEEQPTWQDMMQADMKKKEDNFVNNIAALAPATSAGAGNVGAQMGAVAGKP